MDQNISKWRVPRVKVKCEICKHTFLRKESLIGTHIYCSQTCSKGKQGRTKLPYQWLYNRLIKTAKDKNVLITISYKDFCRFTKTPRCHYCKIKIVWSKHASTAGKLNTASYNLDRKDTSQGYISSNLVVCCARCNWGKGNIFDYKEWKEIGKTIQRLQFKKIGVSKG